MATNETNKDLMPETKAEGGIDRVAVVSRHADGTADQSGGYVVLTDPQTPERTAKAPSIAATVTGRKGQ